MVSSLRIVKNGTDEELIPFGGEQKTLISIPKVEIQKTCEMHDPGSLAGEAIRPLSPAYDFTSAISIAEYTLEW